MRPISLGERVINAYELLNPGTLEISTLYEIISREFCVFVSIFTVQSVIFYAIYETVHFQFTHFPYDEHSKSFACDLGGGGGGWGGDCIYYKYHISN